MVLGAVLGPDFALRRSSSFFSTTEVTKEITFKVGQGLTGALANGHSAPVTFMKQCDTIYNDKML